MFDAIEHSKMLKLFRKKAKKTQEQMAEELNLTQSCISKYENGNKTIDLLTFIRWVNITGSELQAAALLFGIDTVNTLTQLVPLIPLSFGGFVSWML